MHFSFFLHRFPRWRQNGDFGIFNLIVVDVATNAEYDVTIVVEIVVKTVELVVEGVIVADVAIVAAAVKVMSKRIDGSIGNTDAVDVRKRKLHLVIPIV